MGSRSGMDKGNIFFTEQVVKMWNLLLQNVVAPSVGSLKSRQIYGEEISGY